MLAVFFGAYMIVDNPISVFFVIISTLCRSFINTNWLSIWYSFIVSPYVAPCVWFLLGVTAASIPSLASCNHPPSSTAPLYISASPPRDQKRDRVKSYKQSFHAACPPGHRRVKCLQHAFSQSNRHQYRPRSTHSLRLRRENHHILQPLPPTIHERGMARIVAAACRRRILMPRDMPRNVSRNKQWNTPRDMPRDMPRNVSRDKQWNMPRNMPRDIPRDVPRNVSKQWDMPRSMSRNMPGNKPRDVPKFKSTDYLSPSLCHPCNAPTGNPSCSTSTSTSNACSCTSCNLKQQLRMHHALPRQHTCRACNTVVGIFDQSEPVQCHNCLHYYVPANMKKMKRCKCRKPTKYCKNLRCVSHFLSKGTYINNHHRVETPTSSPTDSPSSGICATYHHRHVNASFCNTQSSITKGIAHLPRYHRRQALSSMVASISSTKEYQSQKEISFQIRDLSSCFNIIWDSGASVCVTPSKTDFVSFQPCTIHSEVEGIGGKNCKIAGKGRVRWYFIDVNGHDRCLELEAFHVPKCNARLLSMSQLLRDYPEESVTIRRSHLELSGSSSTSKIMVPFDPSSNLPISLASNSGKAHESASKMLYNVTITTDEGKKNLSPAEKKVASVALSIRPCGIRQGQTSNANRNPKQHSSHSSIALSSLQALFQSEMRCMSIRQADSTVSFGKGVIIS